MKNRIFTSFDEWQEYFFPEKYKRRMFEEMTFELFDKEDKEKIKQIVGDVV